MLPLRVFLNERLAAVAEEILGAVEKTIAVYQEEILRSKDLEIRQLRMQLRLLQSEPESDNYPEAEQLHSPPPPSASPSVHSNQSPPAVAAAQEEEEEEEQQQQPQPQEEDDVCCVDEELPESSRVKEETEDARGDSANNKRHFWMVHDAAEGPEGEAQEFISPHTGLPTTLHEQALHFQQLFTGSSSNNNNNNGGGSGDESGHKPYICSVCDKRFTNCSHLAAHIRTHTGERPFMCDICRKTFITTSALNRHQTIHTEGKRYICAYCGKSFKWMESLGRHVRSVHKSDNVRV